MSITLIKEKITKLYETNPTIHLSSSVLFPKSANQKHTLKLTGVYPYIFQAEENQDGKTVKHTFRYNDIVIGQIVIDELGDIEI